MNFSLTAKFLENKKGGLVASFSLLHTLVNALQQNTHPGLEEGLF